MNIALSVAALSQVRMQGGTVRAYYDLKITRQGSQRIDALHQRRLADHVWQIMIVDERHASRA